MSLFPKQELNILTVSRDDPNDIFSGFSRHSFNLEDKEWPSVEHYYQAMKFEDIDYQETIRLAAHPKKARKLGRSRRRKIRTDWKAIRSTIMSRGLYTKVMTYPEIAEALLKTGDTPIKEKTLYSYYWGTGRDGRGLNTYGKVLMAIRAKLMEQQSTATHKSL